MNPQDPLAALHPLREPLPVGWWPPAPGWWLLAAAVLVTLLVLGWVLYKRYRANAYRRRALAQFSRLVDEYGQSGDSHKLLTETNALLKSVALVAFARRDVASCSGATWLAFLNNTLPEEEQFPPGFAAASYSKGGPNIDIDRLQRAASAWIRKHEATP